MEECGDSVVVFIATGGELKEEEKNTLALDLLYYSYMKPNLLKIKKLEKEGGSFRRIWSEACFICSVGSRKPAQIPLRYSFVELFFYCGWGTGEKKFTRRNTVSVLGYGR